MPGQRRTAALNSYVDITLNDQTFQGQIKASLKGIRFPAATDTSLRLQRVVALFRALIGIVLIFAGFAFTEPRLLGERLPGIFMTTAVIFTALAWANLLFIYRRPQQVQILVPVMLLVDIVGITVMMHASGGISSGIGGMLVLFVGTACLNLFSRHAFLGAALAALAVLGEQSTSFILGQSPANAFLPAGVLGAIIFATTSVANLLSRRLLESEALARQRGIDLANMAQLNDYIIQHLRESIVVVDKSEQIRLMNQSAAEHLGVDRDGSGRLLSAVVARTGRHPAQLAR